MVVRTCFFNVLFQLLKKSIMKAFNEVMMASEI